LHFGVGCSHGIVYYSRALSSKNTSQRALHSPVGGGRLPASLPRELSPKMRFRARKEYASLSQRGILTLRNKTPQTNTLRWLFFNDVFRL
jgi:hypothetical protein